MDAKDIDLQRVLHIYNVETLYAAVVEGYVEWRTALVPATCTANRRLEDSDQRQHFAP